MTKTNLLTKLVLSLILLSGAYVLANTNWNIVNDEVSEESLKTEYNPYEGSQSKSEDTVTDETSDSTTTSDVTCDDIVFDMNDDMI